MISSRRASRGTRCRSRTRSDATGSLPNGSQGKASPGDCDAWKADAATAPSPPPSPHTAARPHTVASTPSTAGAVVAGAPGLLPPATASTDGAAAASASAPAAAPHMYTYSSPAAVAAECTSPAATLVSMRPSSTGSGAWLVCRPPAAPGVRGSASPPGATSDSPNVHARCCGCPPRRTSHTLRRHTRCVSDAHGARAASAVVLLLGMGAGPCSLVAMGLPNTSFKGAVFLSLSLSGDLLGTLPAARARDMARCGVLPAWGPAWGPRTHAHTHTHISWVRACVRE
eukprot:366412-Chlamydomonas_euryale.AAC.16